MCLLTKLATQIEIDRCDQTRAISHSTNISQLQSQKEGNWLTGWMSGKNVRWKLNGISSRCRWYSHWDDVAYSTAQRSLWSLLFDLLKK